MRADGRPRDALRAAQDAIPASFPRVAGNGGYEVWVEALEAALDAGELAAADDLLARVAQPATRPILRAHAARYRARVAVTGSGPAAGLADFRQAAARFAALKLPFHVAMTCLEHAESLVALGRAKDAQPLLDRARPIFTRLEAEPWLARAQALTQSREPGMSAAG